MNNQMILQRDGQTAWIKIQRPEALNALSREIMDEMDILVEQVKADPEVRVLLFYGEENFAAGADIKVMANCDAIAAKEFLFTSTYNKIHTLAIPTIAVMNGYAFGGGLELSLHCDFRIVSKTAKLGLTEVNLGIMPGAGGTVMLPRLVGEGKAKELIYFGRTITGEEAQRIGLANLAVVPEELLATAKQWAENLCARSKQALAAAKHSMEHGIGFPEIESACNYEGVLWAELFNSPDPREGLTAFLEKRKPKYTAQ